MLFASLYNAVLGERGFRLPKHLVPVVHALMDSRITKLMIIIGPGSGKSQLLSVIYPACELGLDPSNTILGVSAGENLVQGFMTSTGQIVEFDKTYQRFFPDTRPNKDVGWSTERGLFVTGHKSSDPDASYFSAGLTSKSLTGKHGRVLIMDDLHDAENSSSIDACNKVIDRYYNTLLGRADPMGARLIVAGRRWHESDLYDHLQREGDFVTMVLPAERKGKELYWDVTVPENPDGSPLKCCFNE